TLRVVAKDEMARHDQRLARPGLRRGAGIVRIDEPPGDEIIRAAARTSANARLGNPVLEAEVFVAGLIAPDFAFLDCLQTQPLAPRRAQQRIEQAFAHALLIAGNDEQDVRNLARRSD